jgi:hypothetical protein
LEDGRDDFVTKRGARAIIGHKRLEISEERGRLPAGRLRASHLALRWNCCPRKRKLGWALEYRREESADTVVTSANVNGVAENGERSSHEQLAVRPRFDGARFWKARCAV